MNPQDPNPHEEQIHRVLSRLPDRRAPRSLEQRVMAEIARREARPRWLRNYTAWPLWLRGAFMLCDALIIAALAIGPGRLLGPIALRIESVAYASGVVRGLVSSAQAIAGAIPREWLYGALGAAGLSWALLAGLGAVLFRAASRLRNAPALSNALSQ